MIQLLGIGFYSPATWRPFCAGASHPNFVDTKIPLQRLKQISNLRCDFAPGPWYTVRIVENSSGAKAEIFDEICYTSCGAREVHTYLSVNLSILPSIASIYLYIIIHLFDYLSVWYMIYVFTMPHVCAFICLVCPFFTYQYPFNLHSFIVNLLVFNQEAGSS